MELKTKPESVRPAGQTDLQHIAVIHKSQFGDHLLGQYSTGLLARFYREFLGRSIFLVHEAGTGVDGFLVGGDDWRLAEARAAFCIENRVRCLMETMVWPRVWLTAASRGAGALVYMVRAKRRQASAPSTASDTRLLSIVVARAAMGTGAATALVRAFEREITGATDSYGLSVKKSNVRAIAFYRKLGFEMESESNGGMAFRRNIAGSGP